MTKRINISDDEFLNVVKNHTYEESAKILQCSFSYCWNRARALGVRKSPGRKTGSAPLQFKEK